MTKRFKRSSMEDRRRKGYASFEPDTPAMRILAARETKAKEAKEQGK